MKLNIRQRVATFIIYLVASYFLFAFITENWLIKTGNNSVWFVSVVAYFLYYLFVTYYFVKPQDSLATSITTFFILVTLDIADVSYNAIILRTIGIVISLSIIMISILNITIHKSEKWLRLNKVTYKICQYMGNGEVLFLPILLFCSLTFTNIDAVVWLNSYWFFIIMSRPIELLFIIFEKVNKNQEVSIGKITRVDSPNLVRVELNYGCEWEHDNYISQLPNEKWIRIMPVDKQFHSNKLLGTGIYCECPKPDDSYIINMNMLGEVCRATDRKEVAEIILGEKTKDIDYLGFIIENSSISTVNIEITNDVDVEEGYILFVKQRNCCIYYQIIDGITTEEVFANNPKGKTIIRAFQLGVYSNTNGFSKYSWVPAMNTPVFLVKNPNSARQELQTNEIGIIPNSNMRIKVDLDDLVTYHSAILGVTGTGKTELAFDIIKKNINRGVKVFCADFTGDYKVRLKDLEPTIISLKESTCEELKGLIENVETGKYGGSDEKKKLNQYLSKLGPFIYKQVIDYIDSSSNLAIIELPEISNTRASLKITEMYLSSLFNWAKNNRNSKIIQIVLEEAHTIIPENNMFKYDKVDTDSVIGRLSQIALQGRKYDVGLMLISQRTALVSKTILSQCNTFFTFNLIDKTSLDFLSNVYSNDHVDTIKNLKKLQLLTCGKAIKSENPVIVEIPYDTKKEEASRNISNKEVVNTEETVATNNIS